jgi:1,4-dihydroxy-2-naphthoate octaprenyltransferase
MTPIPLWIAAFRPKTLIASISPILIGTVLALTSGHFNLAIFLYTLLTGVGIQIATNLANDYFDYLKGADTEERKGPMRLTQSGEVSLTSIKIGVITSFIIPALTGSYLIMVGGLPIALLLMLALLMAFAYTAGPFPLAYLGLGDIFVLIFFGPVAVAATNYLQTGAFSWQAALIGLVPGCISCAILVINNLRDVDEDRAANKKTLIVRFGKRFGRWEFIAAVVLPALIPLAFPRPFAWLTLLALLPALTLIYDLKNVESAQGYAPLFAKTGQYFALYTLVFAFSWML